MCITFFDQSTLELVTFMFLSVKCTTGFTKCANTRTYSFVVDGKVSGNCFLSVRKMCCSCASFHIWRPFNPPIPTKSCLSLYYNITVDGNLFKK